MLKKGADTAPLIIYATQCLTPVLVQLTILYKKIQTPPKKKMTVFNRLIFNPYVDYDMCPTSPIRGLLDVGTSTLFIVIKHWLMLHTDLISLQTIYLHFFVFANNFFKNFPPPPPKK
jgi:hypothetical protein